MGMWEARNKFAGVFNFRELELHFTVLYMVFAGNFRSGFCWYIYIWLLLKILELVFVLVGISVYVFC